MYRETGSFSFFFRWEGEGCGWPEEESVGKLVFFIKVLNVVIGNCFAETYYSSCRSRKNGSGSIKPE